MPLKLLKKQTEYHDFVKLMMTVRRFCPGALCHTIHERWITVSSPVALQKHIISQQNKVCTYSILQTPSLHLKCTSTNFY